MFSYYIPNLTPIMTVGTAIILYSVSEVSLLHVLNASRIFHI
jgi:hypothetical protein